MVRANVKVAGGLKAERRGWGRSLVRGMLQGAVIFAVGASVPGVWGAGGGGVAPRVAGGGKVSLHVDNVPVGSARFSNMGAVTTVTTGAARTVINYSYLNVGAGATLNFVQPTSNSAVLNRISGANPTRIDGAITSNGAVWLVNPGGVFFGKGAVINTGQFVAAAAHVTDAAFVGGVKNFTGASGSVVNMGTINAQEVHLAGLNVANFGTIAAGDGGIVTMTSGKDVYIGTVSSPAAKPLVMVKVSNAGAAPAPGSGTGVVNAGSVRAPGGQVVVGAGDLFAAGIYNSGTVAAQRVT
ncbi:MAG: filamentous hemagglutinin N-terminal domain-containing protein, partial [Phycisphaerae bacterium]